MSLAQTAALLADQTRAAFCMALLDGRAWTVGELARHARVSPPTASEHLTRLIAGGLLAEDRQGRHRYVRLANPTAAALIEDLASYSPLMPTPKNLRESAQMSAEARARTCYDHLAGTLGVAIADAMTDRGFLTDDRGLAVTEMGLARLTDLGIDLASRKRSRPVIRPCLDWTERRIHLAGVVGAALCDWALRRHLIERIGSGRALRVTPDGQRVLGESFGIEMCGRDGMAIVRQQRPTPAPSVLGRHSGSAAAHPARKTGSGSHSVVAESSGPVGRTGALSKPALSGQKA
ncbi:helix-turn-helix domain-containing protein [Micromonospora sp. NEAU-HG-1]|nr:helix-turn-helix domain-containing protein [Micromonospora rubida]